MHQRSRAPDAAVRYDREIFCQVTDVGCAGEKEFYSKTNNLSRTHLRSRHWQQQEVLNYNVIHLFILMKALSLNLRSS